LREGDNPARLARIFSGTDGVELVLALAEGDGATRIPDGAHIKTVATSRGRARQMNAGARSSSGDILLFLHADTVITPESLDNVRKTLSRPGVVGGAYRLKIVSPRLSLKIVSAGANLRSRFLGMPYGDQAIFVKREVFENVGGYEDIPIMEDVRFVETLRKIGKVVLMEDCAETSPRRWEKKGVVIATLRNIALIALYKLGVNPNRLAGWYVS
jgi:rSAM/selenodomain-associated transferase 2